MHFIANMVQEKYPELAAFHTELRFVDKAALGKKYHNYCSSHYILYILQTMGYIYIIDLESVFSF